MSKYIWILGLLMTTLSIWSCSNDDDYTTFHYVARGIDSIAMPDSARFGNRIEVRTFTTIRDNCQQFQSHGYDIVGNERTITAWFVEWDEENCGQDREISPHFYFMPQNPGTFHFRFWAGRNDTTGEDNFIHKSINIYE